MNLKCKTLSCCIIFVWTDRFVADKYYLILTSGGSILGVKFLDPLAGIFVSGMILKAGLDTGYQRYPVCKLMFYILPSERSFFSYLIVSHHCHKRFNI